MKIIITILTTFFFLIIVVFSMGGGHGTLLLAKVVYPFSMLISILVKNGIGIFPVIIAIIQIPIYSLILIKKPNWKFIILGLHILAVIICLNLASEMFE